MNRRMDEAWFPPYLCFHSESGQDLPLETIDFVDALLTDKTEAEIDRKISKVYIVSPECFLMQVKAWSWKYKLLTIWQTPVE